jgi:hypothetical protein
LRIEKLEAQREAKPGGVERLGSVQVKSGFVSAGIFSMAKAFVSGSLRFREPESLKARSLRAPIFAGDFLISE